MLRIQCGFFYCYYFLFHAKKWYNKDINVKEV
ncbi:hypothetical protein QFZ81_006429 [Paenibacillus sp. V4I9]|nr:hypothetical protein [Paenibacillus sp. V4I9]